MINICLFCFLFRYYAHSEHEILKIQFIQLILLLEAKIPETERKLLFKFVTGELLLHGQQPSVRFFLEWLMIRICLHSKEIWESWWDQEMTVIHSFLRFYSQIFQALA